MVQGNRPLVGRGHWVGVDDAIGAIGRGPRDVLIADGRFPIPCARECVWNLVGGSGACGKVEVDPVVIACHIDMMCPRCVLAS